jgi:hypothetical protein
LAQDGIRIWLERSNSLSVMISTLGPHDDGARTT